MAKLTTEEIEAIHVGMLDDAGLAVTGLCKAVDMARKFQALYGAPFGPSGCSDINHGFEASGRLLRALKRLVAAAAE